MTRAMNGTGKDTDWVAMTERGLLFYPLPTFHEYGKSFVPYPGQPDDEELVWTRCGRVIYRYPNPAGGKRMTRYFKSIRRSHAAKFGRPCDSCAR